MNGRPYTATLKSRTLSPGRAVLIPCALAGLELAYLLVPQIRVHAVLGPSFIAAAFALVAWAALLYVTARRSGRTLSLQIVLRQPHYVQATAQLILLLYWGWHVRTVYGWIPFILAQLIFAYAVDSLLQWSRRDTYQLGFGPFPIILSINFFLWFRPDWFYFQFCLIAVGYLAKELIRWTKDGRSAHIFNPSSFPLSVASLILITTGMTRITFGLEIAQSLFNPPHIYVVIFLVALPGMLLFGITTMTISAVVTAYAWGLIFHAATGEYYFFDAYIPIAVFLGMNLLFTDPSTSPRTEGGRVIFGMLYALLTIGLAAALNAIDAPTFYDKLLPIPVCNLLIQRIDRVAVRLADSVGGMLSPVRALGMGRPRLATWALWVVTFVGMSAAGGVGDDHPGQYLPFWDNACTAGSARACEYLGVMQSTYCDRGSGWACNELGVQQAERWDDRTSARMSIQRGCDLDFAAACENLQRMTRGSGPLERAGPRLEDLPIVVRGSKGPVMAHSAEELYALACRRGWPGTCSDTPGTAEP